MHGDHLPWHLLTPISGVRRMPGFRASLPRALPLSSPMGDASSHVPAYCELPREGWTWTWTWTRTLDFSLDLDLDPRPRP